MQNKYSILDEEEEEEQWENKEETVPDNNNNSTKLAICNSSMSESGYWRMFKNIDCTGVFSTQHLFQEMLLPVCESSVSTFIFALCNAFTQWRDANWSNCFTVVIKDAVKFQLAIDTWRESIRVQRLMMQHLLAELLNYNFVQYIHCNTAVQHSKIKEECCQDSQYHEQTKLQEKREGVSTSSVQNDNKTWNNQNYEESINKKYVKIAHTFALLYIVDKLWECDLSSPFRLAVTATEAASYYKTIKDVVSLDHLYQSIYNDFAFAMQEEEEEWERMEKEPNKPELEQLSSNTAKEKVNKHKNNAFDEHKAFDFVSLRERLAVLLRNCERFNEIGSSLALDAEKLVKLGNRLIREMQSEGSLDILEHLQKINSQDANNGYVGMRSK